MSMKRPFYMLLVMFTAVLLLSGCDRTGEKLRVAAHKWPGYEFMFLSQREGWFDKKSINIKETQSASESLEALASGEVDGAALTLDEVLRARADGIPLQVVLVFDESAGADALIAKNKIRTLAELKGQRIGVEKSAVGGLMLHKILQTAKLSEDSVKIIDSTVDNHIKDWQNNKFDAVITFEPVSAQLEEQGGQRLFDTREAPDLILDVLAVRPDVAQKYASELRELIHAHFKALKHMRNNPHDAAYRMAEHLGLMGDRVLNVFKGLELPNLDINRRYLSSGNAVSLAAKELSNVMVKMKALPEHDSMVELVTIKYLPEKIK